MFYADLCLESLAKVVEPDSDQSPLFLIYQNIEYANRNHATESIRNDPDPLLLLNWKISSWAWRSVTGVREFRTSLFFLTSFESNLMILYVSMTAKLLIIIGNICTNKLISRHTVHDASQANAHVNDANNNTPKTKYLPHLEII